MNNTCVPLSRTRRTVVEAALEARYGLDPGGADQIYLYENFNPIAINATMDMVNEDIESHQSRKILFNSAIQEYRGNLFMYGSGIPLSPPYWTILLEMCGLTPYQREGVTCFRPNFRQSPSGTIRTYLDSFRHVLTGCRGSFGMMASAGYPVALSTTLMGRYSQSQITATVNPTTSLPGIIPPTLRDAYLRIIPDDLRAEIIPIFKGFAFDSGISVTQIVEDTDDPNAFLFEFTEDVTPGIGLTIEVNRDRNYFLDMADERKFSIEFLVGQDEGNKWRFLSDPNPYTFTAQLQGAPPYSDDSGIRTYVLNFALTGPQVPFELRHE